MTKEELKQEAEEYLHKDGTEAEKLVKDIGMLCLTKRQLNGIFAIFKQIYIDSAEPREKRIAELKADNDARKFAMVMSEKVEKQLQKEKCELIGTIQARDKTIQELEKENAELKSLKDVADLIRLNNSHIVAMAQLNNNNVALRKENAELKKDMASAVPLLEKATVISDLLNKAKDLIKWFVWYFREGSPNLVPYKHKVEEAEQFISEVEK